MAGLTKKHFKLFASNVRMLLTMHPEFTHEQRRDIIAAVRNGCIDCYEGSYGFDTDKFNDACTPEEKTAHE